MAYSVSARAALVGFLLPTLRYTSSLEGNGSIPRYVPPCEENFKGIFQRVRKGWRRRVFVLNVVVFS